MGGGLAASPFPVGEGRGARAPFPSHSSSLIPFPYRKGRAKGNEGKKGGGQGK